MYIFTLENYALELNDNNNVPQDDVKDLQNEIFIFATIETNTIGCEPGNRSKE